MNWFVVCSLTLAIFIVVALAFENRRRMVKQKQMLGILCLKRLRILLANVQKHRGLTTALIKGEKSALASVDRLQDVINGDIKSVEKIGGWFESNEQWMSLVEHWRRLHINYIELTVENNLEQHGKLIKNVLYLIEEMAEEHHLLRVSQFKEFGFDSLWTDLLMAAEYMGQARALGMGIVASGECGSVDRIRINYLHDKIKASTALLDESMRTAYQTRSSIDRLISCMEQELIASPPKLTANEYFDLATKAIDSLYAQFDKALA